MTTPASTNLRTPSAHAAATLMSTPTSVSTFGWMRRATHAAMIARSGSQQMAPMSPVKVIRDRVAACCPERAVSC